MTKRRKPGYHRFKTSMKHPVYKALKYTIQKQLKIRAYASFEDALRINGFDIIKMSPNWEFVRRAIEHEWSTELMPLAPLFFEVVRLDGQIPIDNIGKYCPGGGGKSTAGWLIPKLVTGPYIEYRQHRRAAVAAGVSNNHNEYGEIARTAGYNFSRELALEERSLFPRLDVFGNDEDDYEDDVDDIDDVEDIEDPTG